MIRVRFLFGNGLLLLVGSALWASSAQAAKINKDLVNTGTTDAYSLVIILEGDAVNDISEYYNGYPTGIQFNHCNATSATGRDNGDTYLHWHKPNRPIGPNQLVHVGWTIRGGQPTIKDMYWRDQMGHRIKGSIAEAAVQSFVDGRNFNLKFQNFFVPKKQQPVPLFISDIRFAIVVNPWDLADLNPQNRALMAQLRPLQPFLIVNPGETILLTLPQPPPPNGFVVVVYNVDAPGSLASSQDFAQMDALGQ